MVFTIVAVSSQQSKDKCICQTPCDNACPAGLYLNISYEFVNISECVYPTTTSSYTSTDMSTAETTTQMMSTSTMNTTTEISGEPKPEVFYLCLSSCPEGFFANSSNVCDACDLKCNNCTGSGDTVDVCSCLHGSENGTCLAAKQPETGFDKAIIIGAAAGGGAVVVIILIVSIVYICKRTRRMNIQKSSRMSVILDTRDDSKDNTVHIIETENDQRRGKNPTLQRQNYENTNTIDDSKVAAQAQRNQDKIFRYVKDPATGKTTKVLENVNRESDVYSNASAIRLQKNIEGVSSEDVELSMLGEAPRPPAAISKKKKKSMFKISMKKISLKKSKQPEGAINQGMDDQEDYEDMSGQQPAPPNQNDSDMPLEDYENFGKTSALVNQNQTVEDDEDLEDYENVQNALSKAKIDDEDDMEDYENCAIIPTIPNRTNMMIADDEPSEDYENFNRENPYMNVGELTK
ncbi:unnamed protein product [Mytilus edulis]|uniref:PCSK5 n=1 Tax=Mytilus edulis TaxID=6550 RepID=A0A8S3SZZ6_MYTED|nr:unnamed protein product [Mytilus edulis]